MFNEKLPNIKDDCVNSSEMRKQENLSTIKILRQRKKKKNSKRKSIMPVTKNPYFQSRKQEGKKEKNLKNKTKQDFFSN